MVVLERDLVSQDKDFLKPTLTFAPTGIKTVQGHRISFCQV